ncbi:Hypothetical protein ORPV_185 [Orpheovirus IHUMI-LCC2]|uniref:Uncharacterized protein n=1 Tax=Orpheovirus IHUMI-LCC2 TaxID=2023057 RepID=A0A2I2L3N5_9VIRU|nr:Hypothetical protein ORPV_185 [Orpheovirus IHUMI-LCC2]SNW62089.1 Hypothetical protein ORPV_185 [Orpheovirus IHUMI-LCC2]
MTFIYKNIFLFSTSTDEHDNEIRQKWLKAWKDIPPITFNEPKTVHNTNKNDEIRQKWLKAWKDLPTLPL